MWFSRWLLPRCEHQPTRDCLLMPCNRILLSASRRLLSLAVPVPAQPRVQWGYTGRGAQPGELLVK
ncbi:hypothetical protein A6R68_00298 [Neotoma lepida]|uniref:Uncharacterized protein n=1 Tax=Neotoma lepida TaxID=56216 RepID=A0A1A6GYW0_NEOLE|nr:hypothetical protein A6R68_00298 [Neotoma lepida]